MNVCNYCGLELFGNEKYCPNCAEPVTVKTKKEITDDLPIALTQRFFKGSLIDAASSLAITFVFTFAVNDSFKGFWMYSLSIFTFGLVFVIVDMMIVKNSKRKSSIVTQFETDKTSICPQCGSHNIIVYRKGYNWNGAYWGNSFGIKGSRYLAGVNSNNAMCQCRNCGRQWNSHYDIRKIK